MSGKRVTFRDGYAEGFRMAVPDCFEDELRKGVFQQGDTIYDTAKAYCGTWASAVNDISYWVQVKHMTGDMVSFVVYRKSDDLKSFLPGELQSLPSDDFISLLRNGIEFTRDVTV